MSQELKRKCIILVIDGMADLPDPGSGRNVTPLEIAKTPNLDRIARDGITGYVHSVGFWKTGGSDTSHIALLGYDPWKTYTGRGPIEVAGTGVKLLAGDVSLRCNYCTVSGKDFRLVDRTASYIREGIEEIADAINNEVLLSEKGIHFEFRNSQDYRCVVYFRGQGISWNISDMDPSYNVIVPPAIKDSLKKEPRVVDCQPMDASPEAARMASILTEWVKKVHDVLDKHPVNEERRRQGKPPGNCVMPRGAGSTPVYEPFETKWGMKGACVAGTGLIKGVGALLGMDVPDVPGATGYIDSDLLSKARVTVECLEKGNDFVLTHIEGVDEVAHDGDVEMKVKMIERSDEMLGYLMDNVPPNTVICVLSDHSTVCAYGDHSADPSPIGFWAADGSIRGDGIVGFAENTAYKGSVGHIEGRSVMPFLLQRCREPGQGHGN